MKIARAPWKDAQELPGYSDWKKWADAIGGKDDDILHMHIVRGLVREVIVAAGGIEREIQALKSAQEFAEVNRGCLPDPVPQPEMGLVGFAPGHAALHSAYAAMNALTWIRAVHERVKRDDAGDAGLLAALKGGEPRETINAAFVKLSPDLKDARKFDNYVLHAGGLQGGGTPEFHVRQDHTVYFPFPDKPNKKRFFTWEQFTYKQECDALSYFEGKFDAVATFVDKMLDAFDALPLQLP